VSALGKKRFSLIFLLGVLVTPSQDYPLLLLLLLV